MDPDRFLRELPALFDDFPRSTHPRERRFDDIVRDVPNLAEENTLAVVNLATSLLGPGESYVEAGTYMGASLIAAARGNEGADCVAIDNFSFGPTQFGTRVLPAADRAELEANLARFGTRATILAGDTADVPRSGRLGSRRVGAFFYDASHRLEPQLEAWPLIEPYLVDGALLIIDNADSTDVRRALDRYRAGQTRVELLLHIQGRKHGSPQWWDGTSVLKWNTG